MNVAKTQNVFFNQTEFQIHQTFDKKIDRTLNNTLDFTERKLIQSIKFAWDPKLAVKLECLLSRYRSGIVAIAWRDGLPVYVIIDTNT